MKFQTDINILWMFIMLSCSQSPCCSMQTFTLIHRVSDTFIQQCCCMCACLCWDTQTYFPVNTHSDELELVHDRWPTQSRDAVVTSHQIKLMCQSGKKVCVLVAVISRTLWKLLSEIAVVVVQTQVGVTTPVPQLFPLSWGRCWKLD